MHRIHATIAASAFALVAMTGATVVPAQAQTEIQWWHAMPGANNELVEKLAKEFNASQSEYKVVPVFKGTYPETLNAGIAAFRAKQPPHIIQVFDVGTGVMMGAEKRHQAGRRGDEGRRAAASTRPVSARHRLLLREADGTMLSFPFNSSSRRSSTTIRTSSGKPGSTPRSRRRPGRSVARPPRRSRQSGRALRLSPRPG